MCVCGGGGWIGGEVLGGGGGPWGRDPRQQPSVSAD